MNVLLVGSGGREHALAWKLIQSKLLTSLHFWPGNAAMSGLGESLDVGHDHHQDIVEVVRDAAGQGADGLKLLCLAQLGVQALALEEQISGSYVTRVMYLAFLAPDLVQRIVPGDHPLDLTADRLMDMVPLPEAWEAQRVLLGMSG